MFKYIILLSALFISVCAGWFSISGISQLFIGAHTQATIMAISLELGKLVSVSFVYRNWNILSRYLKYYMVSGSVILSIITSLGIYGYLSAAYSSAAVEYKTKQNQISVITTQQNSFNSIIDNNRIRIEELSRYRNKQETRLDSLVGRNGFVTQQNIIRQSDNEIRSLQQQTSKLIFSRDSLEVLKVQQQGEVATSSKLGTFWYIAQSLNMELDVIVKWFVLTIVFVFDPLAISLLVSYNFLIKNESPKPEKKIPILTGNDHKIDIQTGLGDRQTDDLASPLPPQPQIPLSGMPVNVPVD